MRGGERERETFGGEQRGVEGQKSVYKQRKVAGGGQVKEAKEVKEVR